MYAITQHDLMQKDAALSNRGQEGQPNLLRACLDVTMTRTTTSRVNVLIQL